MANWLEGLKAYSGLTRPWYPPLHRTQGWGTLSRGDPNKKQRLGLALFIAVAYPKIACVAACHQFGFANSRYEAPACKTIITGKM